MGESAIDAIGRKTAPFLLPVIVACLCIHVRGTLSAVIAIVFIAVLVSFVRDRRLPLDRYTLAVLAATLGLTVYTVASRQDFRFERIDHYLLLALFAAAAIETVKRYRLTVSPGTVAILSGLVCAFMVGYSTYSLLGLPARPLVSGYEVHLINHRFSKALFLLIPLLLVFAYQLKRSGHVRMALVSATFAAAAALGSSSLSTMIGLVLAAGLAFTSVGRVAAPLSFGAILAVPVVAAVSASDLLASGAGAFEAQQVRLVLWEAALRMVAERPVLGWGFDGFDHLRRTGFPMTVDHHAHSSVMAFLVDFGLAGALAALALVWVISRQVTVRCDTIIDRLLLLTPFYFWFFVQGVSLQFWTDYLFAGTFVLVMAARVEAPEAAIADRSRPEDR